MKSNNVELGFTEFINDKFKTNEYQNININ